MENNFQNSMIFFFGSGSVLNFDVPDKTRIFLYEYNDRLGIQMIIETKSLAFFLLDNEAECNLNVKDTFKKQYINIFII